MERVIGVAQGLIGIVWVIKKSRGCCRGCTGPLGVTGIKEGL